MERRLAIIAREVAIIAREIDAMTDEEQAQFLALSGGAPTPLMIRPAAFELHLSGYDEIACSYCGLKNWVPRKRPAGTPRKCGRCRMLLGHPVNSDHVA